MPLRLPDRLPAIDILKNENIFVMDNSRATTQDIRPLKIVILNLMPLKITTETDLVRLLSNTPLQMEINFMKLKSHTYFPTSAMRQRFFGCVALRTSESQTVCFTGQMSRWSCLRTCSSNPCCRSSRGTA